MMNKLTALFAMILGLALVVPTVDAARRNPARGKAAKAAVEAPVAEVVAEEAEVVAEEAGVAADKAAPKADKAAPKAAKDATPGFFARRQKNLVDAKDWAVANPYKATGVTVGTLVATGLVIEAAKNGKNSLLPRLYRKLAGKSEQHNRLADIMKAKEAAKAA